MSFVVDLTFFLFAALCGVAVAWLVFFRYRMHEPEALDDAQSRFARDTLARLQELTNKVAADVDQHSSAVKQINAQLADTDTNDEAAVLGAVAQLIDANRRMQEQLDTAEQRLQVQARQIESHAVEARTDALTQVANRRALDDEIRRCMADFDSRALVSSVMLIDVDHFKKFNDAHGHQVGDEVLRGVARVLRNSVGDRGLVTRYGGEEFAVVFAGLGFSVILAEAERARQAIAGTSFRFAGRELFVTASAGLAETQAGDQEKEWIRRADEALYSSKKAGRNCGHYSDGRTNHRIRPEALAPTPKPVVTEQVGDEWLFEAEGEIAALYNEPLAHVSNRPTFFDDLIRRLSHWRRGGTAMSLMLVQVDGYARIVGDHGPEAGEVVLRVAAQLINAVMRDMDHVARLGEDTFAMLLPGSQLPSAVAIAERLRSAVERCRLPRRAGGSWFTISVGAIEASDGDDLRRILERARKALQAAANQGRNRVCGHDLLGCVVKQAETVAAK
ncbi:MAG: GGDEF domain-containing protein [Pirellulaceae bacterium]